MDDVTMGIPPLTSAALAAIRAQFAEADGPMTAFLTRNHLPTHGELVQIALAASVVPVLLAEVEQLRALNRELADHLGRLSTIQGTAEAWAIWRSQIDEIQAKVRTWRQAVQAKEEET